MGRASAPLSLFGLLLAVVTALPVRENWDIYSYHINSTVTSRYAITVITSRVANRMEESKEIEFHVRIPKNAFITKFKMVIDGQEYDGIVKEKEKAQQQYSQAVSRGQSAGIVSSVGRTLEEFKTSVTVAAHKKVTFELTYEELLKRRLGKYELQIHARPMQPVKDFKVDVYINENAGINSFMVKGGLSTKELANAVTTTQAEKEAWVHFYPTVDQQKSCDSCDDKGMNGDLIVVYDVNRNTSLGDIQRSPGYFVHHFAPSNLQRIPKNVVFIIDQSGSMHGRKIEQTRTALIHILNDLAEDDFFGLLTFDSNIFQWKRELVQATKANLESAKTFARNIRANGATNINAAVLKGSSMLNAHPREGSASILILLTDGDPTTGETNPEAIQSNVRNAIAEKFPLYCLGFGFDVNFEFLEKMSLQNNGVARRIYEDSDADLQLKQQGFYEEVATPLLTNVMMIYVGGTNLTKTSFSHHYKGSEIVVAGVISDNDVETFAPQVVAISKSRRLVFDDKNATTETSVMASDSQMQRIWAHLTVKQLLDKELHLSGSEKEDAKNEALKLSLRYGFVTPLTSMVVTKPQGESTDVLDKPKEGNTWPRGGVAGPPFHGFGSAAPGKIWTMFQWHTKGNSHISGNAGPPGLPGSRYIGAAESAVCQKGCQCTQHKCVSFQPPLFMILLLLPTMSMTTECLPRLSQQLPQPLQVNFMRKPADGSLPLCFDVPVGRLKLLHHPNMAELTVNGELSSETPGFSKIVIHLKEDQHVEVDSSKIVVRDKQSVSHYSGDEPHTVGSITVIRRAKEIDITVGDTRMVILIHLHQGKEFLWPVLRQRPSDSGVTGILGLQPVVYEEQFPEKLKIDSREIEATRRTAVDYSEAVPRQQDCWRTSAEDALQAPLHHFTISEL
uniref:Inter-alpha-trypsin inhibitor heavy chain 3b, tandem duplicate 2 n=1 Tax=Tetraodon nigroviridis TaxID=99883 RepID=H3C3N0_TETNG